MPPSIGKLSGMSHRPAVATKWDGFVAALEVEHIALQVLDAPAHQCPRSCTAQAGPLLGGACTLLQEGLHGPDAKLPSTLPDLKGLLLLRSEAALLTQHPPLLLQREALHDPCCKGVHPCAGV